MKGWSALSTAAKHTTALVLMLLSTQSLFAQGFDWEYSLRKPRYAPTVFAGPTVSLATTGSSSNIQVLDQVRSLQPAFICAAYNKGKGSSWSAGMQTEWWKWPHTAVGACISYQRFQSDFSADSPQALLADGNIFQTQYLLSTAVHTLNVEVLLKTLISQSHLWLGVRLKNQVLLSVDSKLSENVLQPLSYTFPGTNEQSKLLSDKDIAGVRSFVINPVFQIGYDLNMGRDWYSSLSIGVQAPLMDYTSGTKWSIWSVNFQYSLVGGVASF